MTRKQNQKVKQKEDQQQPSRLAGAYVRVSGPQQANELTIESQIEEIRNYAKEHNLQLIDEWIFKDDPDTGKYLDRPGLDAMRDFVFSHDTKPNVIIIHTVDRLSRIVAHQHVVMFELEQKAKIKVEFVQVKKGKTKEERLVINILAAIAEHEREQIVDRCRRGRKHKAKLGYLSVIPHAPYGYKYITAEGCLKNGHSASYVIDKEAACVIKKIFFLYTRKQLSLSGISKHLYENNIPSPKGGKHWHSSTLRDILRNEAYIGTAYFGKTKGEERASERTIRCKGKKIRPSRDVRVERAKEEWIPITVPALIGESDFEIAQELLNDNKVFAKRNTKHVSLLQGLLVCGRCKCSYYKKLRSTAKKNLTYYCCHSMLNSYMDKCGNSSLRQDALDDLIWKEVVNLMNNSSVIEMEITRRQEEMAKGGEGKYEKTQIEKEIKQHEKAKDKLLDAYQDGVMSVDELRPRMEKIRTQIDYLNQEIKKTEERQQQEEKIMEFKHSLEYLKERIKESSKLSIEDKQKVIRLLVEEVVIDKDSITIKHCVPANLGSKNGPLRCACSEGAPSLG